jgi:L-ascorbate metabolism protein UlaG (beta-lactamase superfamily)
MCSTKSIVTVALVLLLVLSLGGIYLACGEASTPAITPSQPPFAPSPLPPSPGLTPPPPLTPTALTKIQFLGQACFLVATSTGLRIITDPYAVTSTLSYSPVDESADIVTVSHEHSDHNNIAAVKGQPEVVKGVGVKTVKGIEIKGIATWHDASGGAQRGTNTVFLFSVDGVKLCHLGDLGHRLSSEQLSQIGSVDILFIPVGGNYTIDAKTATEVCSDLKPKVIIPMHYKTLKAGLPITGVEDFLQGKENMKRLNSSIFQFRLSDLSSASQIIVLDPAR